MSKMARLEIPDNVYKWIKNFFEEHYHIVLDTRNSVLQ